MSIIILNYFIAILHKMEKCCYLPMIYMLKIENAYSNYFVMKIKYYMSLFCAMDTIIFRRTVIYI